MGFPRLSHGHLLKSAFEGIIKKESKTHPWWLLWVPAHILYVSPVIIDWVREELGHVIIFGSYLSFESKDDVYSSHDIRGRI